MAPKTKVPEASAKTSEQAFSEARELLAKGDYMAADRLIGQLISANNESAEVRVLKGDLLFAQGRNEEATESYRFALHLDLNCGDAYIGLGKALFKERKYEAAADSFLLGCKHSPTAPRESLFLLVDAHIMNNNAEGAKSAAKFADADPDFALPQRHALLKQQGLNPPNVEGCA